MFSAFVTRRFGIFSAALFATCIPTLLAYSVSPSATFLNQAAAVVGWGVFLSVVLANDYLPAKRLLASNQKNYGGRWALILALSILAISAAGARVFGSLPLSLSLAGSLTLLSALVAAVSGVVVADAQRRIVAFQALAWSTVIAGLLGVAIGVVQVFWPDWADGRWVAISALEGRATGNFRQPNHLGSLLLWAVVAIVALGEIHRQQRYQAVSFDAIASKGESALGSWGKNWVASLKNRLQVLWSERRFLRSVQVGALWPTVAILVVGIVLSASRTAAIGLLVLAAWGLLDRRLSPAGRMALCSTPLLYALAWYGMTTWADATDHSFGGAARFSVQGDISSSRFGIWANTLSLIAQHPWSGVGWGGFNFAWSLTPFPARPVAFFDHTHNLVLQLAVELGIPLALTVMGLLVWAFWCVVVAAWRESPGQEEVVLRSSCMMLLLVALHSQLEYPLWYAYFLLPTAFIWGLCLKGNQERCESIKPKGPMSRLSERLCRLPAALPRVGAVCMVVLGAAAVVDYWRVAVIFAPPAGAAPLAQRIERGERSLLFSHHAYYAAATSAALPEDVGLDVFRITTHHLLDTRLMIAWSKALNAQGDVERARHLAARLREFRNPNSRVFFEPCDQPPAMRGEPLPFQCMAPTRAMDWRDFR